MSIMRVVCKDCLFPRGECPFNCPQMTAEEMFMNVLMNEPVPATMPQQQQMLRLSRTERDCPFPVYDNQDQQVVFILDMCRVKMRELGMCEACVNNTQKCKRLASDISASFPEVTFKAQLPETWGKTIRDDPEYARRGWLQLFPNILQRRCSFMMTLEAATEWMDKHAAKALRVRQAKCAKSQAANTPCKINEKKKKRK